MCGELRLALEADKPELARVHEHIEKLKIEIREHHRYVEEQSARASELRSLKKELKGKLVYDIEFFDSMFC
jgi:hypothetical protein